MRRLLIVFLPAILLAAFCSSVGSQEVKGMEGQVQPQMNDPCAECHSRVTPGIVVDWQLSKHSANDVGCATCHGDRHNSMSDAANAGTAGPEVCANCHAPQVEQFRKSKHAAAWESMKAMPSLHGQPMTQVEGMKGCGGCHRVGLKSEQDVRDLVEKGGGFGAGSCDVCHSRHLFSADEARSPQACRTCHMGTDHPQWEMYSSSKHGVRFLLKQSRMLPEDAAAPTCQSCHFQEGDHAVRTAWGYMGLRLPYPQDVQWAKDRFIILQAVGVLDGEGNATSRLGAFESNGVMRFTDDDWQADRDKMLKYCNECHSINFARRELEKGDQMIREADAVMAEGIRMVAALYEEGVLKKPENSPSAFPDLLTMGSAPTVIEQKLFSMFYEYRMRTFQGAFHASPDYSFRYGWSPLQRGLAEIKERAADMRAIAGKASAPPAAGEKKAAPN